jgi:hypothetical protein
MRVSPALETELVVAGIIAMLFAVGKQNSTDRRKEFTPATCLYAYHAKGPAKNKFPFSGVEAPVWQGARSEQYLDM